MSRSGKRRSGSKSGKRTGKRSDKGKTVSSKNKKSGRIRELAVGKVGMTREGYAFISVEGRDEDIFVPARKTRHALNGDTVRVSFLNDPKQPKKAEGEVVEILERSARPHIGILQMSGGRAWVIMEARNMPYDISVPADKVNPADNGKKVAVRITGWPDNEDEPQGIITDVLGLPGENNTEMHAILTEFGLPYRFDDKVEAEAAKISSRITKKEIASRRDYRQYCTFTIDPKDAKDFDDAVSIRKLENGNWEVGVHIADVTHYVKPDSLVEKEASERGTSVYLVDRTVPMLPEKLSNKLCSLRPDEDKLTFSAIFEMDGKAHVINRWFGRTVIRSDYRFDYDSAQEIIKGGEGPLKDEMLQLWDLASQMRKRRFDAGAISFERPEMKIEVDKKGKPIRIVRKVSFEANWLIEEFMLLANREVAEEVSRRMGMKKPTFVYRIHDEPDLEKVANLRNFIHHFGYSMGPTENAKSLAYELNGLLKKVKDKPEASAIEIIALRTMARAEYSVDNVGHYGLGFDYYTHFTSPIRRYPDMMVHRLLAHYLEKKQSVKKDFYEKKCKYSSEREQLATEAERASIKYKMVEFMLDKLGNIYDGTVSGVTEWGIYVEIDDTKVEGMVALRDIKEDYFVFNEEEYCVTGKESGIRFTLGDRVKIKVIKADLTQKQLDYQLVIDGTALESIGQKMHGIHEVQDIPDVKKGNKARKENKSGKQTGAKSAKRTVDKSSPEKATKKTKKPKKK